MNRCISINQTIAIAVASLAFAPLVRAVDPPPDGGYPNQNTAEGDGALFSLTTGNSNTAIGNIALYANTTGSFNTAVGEQALHSNVVSDGNTAVGGDALGTNVASGNTALGLEAPGGQQYRHRQHGYWLSRPLGWFHWQR